jgi:hypothetical protein
VQRRAGMHAIELTRCGRRVPCSARRGAQASVVSCRDRAGLPRTTGDTASSGQHERRNVKAAARFDSPGRFPRARSPPQLGHAPCVGNPPCETGRVWAGP